MGEATQTTDENSASQSYFKATTKNSKSVAELVKYQNIYPTNPCQPKTTVPH